MKWPHLNRHKDGTITCYKFRGIRNLCANCRELDVERIVQILKGDLYCADWRKMNDILEGTYLYGVPKDPESCEKLIINGTKLQSLKESYHVCSMTTRLNSPLMWAFYASDHSGVAIEMRLHYDEPKHEDRGLCPQILPVEYASRIPIIDLLDVDLEADVDGVKAQTIAQHILLHKTNHWRYEREVRLLNRVEHYRLKPELNERIVTVWIGVRTTEEDVKRLKEKFPAIDFCSVSRVYPMMFGKPMDFNKEDDQNENPQH